MRWFFLVISFLIFSGALLAKDTALFTDEEKRYIQSSPSIKIAMLNNFKPFSFVENGHHNGMSKEILDQISSISGLDFSIELSQWTKALESFKSGQVDMISGISYTKPREDFTYFTKPFYEIPTFLFGLKNDNSFKGIESLRGKRIGVSKSIFYIDELKKQGIKVVEVDSSNEKVKKLVLGEIDYFLASYTSGTKAIKEDAITSIKPILEFSTIKKEDLRFGISKQQPILYSIIQKSIQSIDPSVFEEIVNKWIINLDLVVENDNGKKKLFSKFTNEELSYLKNKKQITYCIDPKWMPFEGFEQNHTGISKDYQEIFERKLSIPFKYIQTRSWEESIEFAKVGKCEILSFLTMKTPQRENYFRFTTPYVKVPFVIVTKNDVSFISDLSLLDGRKIAIPEGYASGTILNDLYPNLDIVYVDNIEVGLQKVIKGEIFGSIGTLASIGYLFQNQYIGELKIVGKFEHQWELSVASKKSDELLHSILQKTLDSIKPSEHKDIYNRWVAIKYEQKVDYKKIWQIIIFSLVIIIVILYWNRKLESLNKELKEQQKITKQALMIKSNFLANISHEIRTPMNSIVNMAYLAEQLAEDKKQKEYLEKIEFAANTLLQLINNVLDISKIDAGKTTIHKSEFAIESILRDIESVAITKTIESDIGFKVIVDRDVPSTLIGDSLRIEQVLINLISNAVKFTKSGEVTLSISKIDEEEYQFCISDTGIGMSEEQIEKIFDPFTQGDDTTTRNFGGTGLGLSISKELIELMGGKIWVTSELGVGSHFYFTLPLQKIEEDKSQEAITRQKVRIVESLGKNKRIRKENILISHEDALFYRLKKALEKNRPNISKPLIEELNRYNLHKIDQNRFEQLKNFVVNYKFREALELLNEHY